MPNPQCNYVKPPPDRQTDRLAGEYFPPTMTNVQKLSRNEEKAQTSYLAFGSSQFINMAKTCVQ